MNTTASPKAKQPGARAAKPGVEPLSQTVRFAPSDIPKLAFVVGDLFGIGAGWDYDVGIVKPKGALHVFGFVSAERERVEDLRVRPRDVAECHAGRVREALEQSPAVSGVERVEHVAYISEASLRF